MQNILSILEDAAGGEARAAARAAHPRVGELAARFGDVLRSAPAAPGGTSIAASLLAVRRHVEVTLGQPAVHCFSSASKS